MGKDYIRIYNERLDGMLCVALAMHPLSLPRALGWEYYALWQGAPGLKWIESSKAQCGHPLVDAISLDTW